MRRLYLSCLSVALGVLPVLGQDNPNAADASVAEAQHEVVHANTLWDLAAHYYHDPWQWKRIYEANKSKIKNPHWIYPGQLFLIPGLGKTVAVMPKVEPAEEPKEPQEPIEQPEPPKKEEAVSTASRPAPSEPMDYDPSYGNGEPAADSFSIRLPTGMTGQQPSLYRMRMPKDWAADGRVVQTNGRETAAAEGDVVRVRMDHPETVSRGQRYEVYRRAAPTEADKDQGASYMQKVGLVEVAREVSKKDFQAVILKSGDVVQVDDLLKRSL